MVSFPPQYVSATKTHCTGWSLIFLPISGAASWRRQSARCFYSVLIFVGTVLASTHSFCIHTGERTLLTNNGMLTPDARD